MNIINTKVNLILGVTTEELNYIRSGLIELIVQGGVYGDKELTHPDDIKRQERSVEVSTDLVKHIEDVLLEEYQMECENEMLLHAK